MKEEVSDINEMLKVVNNIQVIAILNIKLNEIFKLHSFQNEKQHGDMI